MDQRDSESETWKNTYLSFSRGSFTYNEVCKLDKNIQILRSKQIDVIRETKRGDKHSQISSSTRNFWQSLNEFNSREEKYKRNRTFTVLACMDLEENIAEEISESNIIFVGDFQRIDDEERDQTKEFGRNWTRQRHNRRRRNGWNIISLRDFDTIDDEDRKRRFRRWERRTDYEREETSFFPFRVKWSNQYPAAT